VMSGECPVCKVVVPDNATHMLMQAFDDTVRGFDHVTCPTCGSELRRRHPAELPSDWWHVRREHARASARISADDWVSVAAATSCLVGL
jgi:hypothetical protein